jgi:PAS domain S-box-containing protein
MSAKPFEAQVSAAVARLAALRERAERATDPEARALLSEGLEELATAFEELHVAQEELRVQMEALVAADSATDAERERYQRLFDDAPSGYLVTDDEGTIRQSNRAAGELLNVEPRFLHGKPLSVFVTSDDRTIFLNLLTGLRNPQPARMCVLRLQPRPEGSEPRVAELTVVPDPDPDTGSVVLRWQLRDITAERRAAADLRKLNTELEARVQSRTAALEDLIREKGIAERKLAEANKRKDEFLATLAHELRNPLGAIRTAVEVMRMRGTLSPDDLTSLGLIQRQARRMTTLIDDLLDLTRIAQGKLRLQPERVDLAEAARTAVDVARGFAAGRELSLDVPGAPIPVRFDTARLDQVLTNLLTNAVKYTDAGGSVTVHVGSDDGQAVVRIRDTGIGMSADFLERVFGLFAQAPVGEERTQGGLGIGLHLVKRLVELHGGTVQASSEGQGRGSEFCVRLPLAREEG